MKKKFYTFAELSNYLTILDKNKNTSLQWRTLYDEFGKYLYDNVDRDTVISFIRYHYHNEGNGTDKIYPKTMWNIEEYV